MKNVGAEQLKDVSSQLRTLGDLTWAEHREVKPLLILTYLSLEGPQLRSRLAELLWPDASDAENNLRVALCGLRHWGAPLRFEGEWCALDLDCDAHTLLECRGVQAADHYAGGFLAGVKLRGVSLEFETWVFEQRERLALHVQHELLWVAQQEIGSSREALLQQAWDVLDAPAPDARTLAQFLSWSSAKTALFLQLQGELVEYGWHPDVLQAACGERTPLVHSLLAWWLDGGVAWLAGDFDQEKQALAHNFADILLSDGLDVTWLTGQHCPNLETLMWTLHQSKATSLAFEQPTVVLEQIDHLGDLQELEATLLEQWPQVRFICMSRQPVNQTAFSLYPVPTPTNTRFPQSNTSESGQSTAAGYSRSVTQQKGTTRPTWPTNTPYLKTKPYSTGPPFSVCQSHRAMPTSLIDDIEGPISTTRLTIETVHSYQQCGPRTRHRALLLSSVAAFSAPRNGRNPPPRTPAAPPPSATLRPRSRRGQCPRQP